MRLVTVLLIAVFGCVSHADTVSLCTKRGAREQAEQARESLDQLKSITIDTSMLSAGMKEAIEKDTRRVETVKVLRQAPEGDDASKAVKLLGALKKKQRSSCVVFPVPDDTVRSTAGGCADALGPYCELFGGTVKLAAHTPCSVGCLVDGDGVVLYMQVDK